MSRRAQCTHSRVDSPNMVIRYLNGRTIQSLIALQARIWERIQEEEELGKSQLDPDDE